LAGEEFVRDHGVFGEFPFPDDPGDDEEEADDEGAEDVGAGPAVGVAAGLEGDEAAECKNGVSLAGVGYLQEGQTGDGENTTDVVNLLENRAAREPFGASMHVREVGECQSDGNDSVVDTVFMSVTIPIAGREIIQCNPRAPSPSLAWLVGPQLHVHQVRAERKDKGGDESERVTTVLDGHDLGQTIPMLAYELFTVGTASYPARPVNSPIAAPTPDNAIPAKA
jgi:hypothetical protein